jgi:hypothetical protein
MRHRPVQACAGGRRSESKPYLESTADRAIETPSRASCRWSQDEPAESSWHPQNSIHRIGSDGSSRSTNETWHRRAKPHNTSHSTQRDSRRVRELYSPEFANAPDDLAVGPKPTLAKIGLEMRDHDAVIITKGDGRISFKCSKWRGHRRQRPTRTRVFTTTTMIKLSAEGAHGSRRGELLR